MRKEKKHPHEFVGVDYGIPGGVCLFPDFLSNKKYQKGVLLWLNRCEKVDMVVQNVYPPPDLNNNIKMEAVKRVNGWKDL